MLDFAHKLLYTGIGFAALTEEKAKDLSAELVRRGEVSAEEGKNLARDLMDRARHQSEQFRKAVEDEVDRVLKSTPVCTRRDMDDLKARLDRLEKCCVPPSPGPIGTEPEEPIV